MVNEYNSAWTVTKSYFIGASLEGQFDKKSDVPKYFHTDGIGSVMKITDTAGTVTDTYDYSEFGEQITSQGNTSNVYKYTGQQSDSDSGFLFLRARYYDPETGRFIMKDKYKGDIKTPVTLHPYIYCKDNPIRWTDPSGYDVVVDDPQGQWDDFSRQLTELTGYTFTLSGGHLKIVCSAGVKYSGTSGAARQLLYQMITGSTTVTLDLRAGIRAIAGATLEGHPERHAIDVGDIKYQLGVHRALALGNLLHELSESYAMAKGSGFPSAHSQGILYENLLRANLGSNLYRSGRDVLLRDPDGDPYGAIINYGHVRARYLFGYPTDNKWPPARIDFIP